jgi:hypothetical protein
MNSTEQMTVSGMVGTRDEAMRVIEELIARAFVRDEISVVMTELPHSGAEIKTDSDSKAAEGAAVGAAVGGVGGAILAAAAAVGSVLIPGLGLIVAGPLLGALTGAVAGTASGAAAGAAVRQEHFEVLKNDLERGAIWVGVHTIPDRVDVAKDALRAAKADRISVF